MILRVISYFGAAKLLFLGCKKCRPKKSKRSAVVKRCGREWNILALLRAGFNCSTVQQCNIARRLHQCNSSMFQCNAFTLRRLQLNAFVQLVSFAAGLAHSRLQINCIVLCSVHLQCRHSSVCNTLHSNHIERCRASWNKLQLGMLLLVSLYYSAVLAPSPVCSVQKRLSHKSNPIQTSTHLCKTLSSLVVTHDDDGDEEETKGNCSFVLQVGLCLEYSFSLYHSAVQAPYPVCAEMSLSQVKSHSNVHSKLFLLLLWPIMMVMVVMRKKLRETVRFFLKGENP